MYVIKLAGAVFILFAATALGFVQSAQYAKRPKQIRDLMQALQSLETEITYGFTPLPQALENIGGSLDAPVTTIFKASAAKLRARDGWSTKEIWDWSVHTHWPDTALGRNEKIAFLQLGEHLGQSDREDQIKHIRLAMDQLRAEENRARSEQVRYEKMWKSLGFLGGLLIVILLI